MTVILDKPDHLSSLLGLLDIREQIFGGSPVHREQRGLTEEMTSCKEEGGNHWLKDVAEET